MMPRCLTGTNWVELIFGAILPGMVLGPFFLMAMFIGPIALERSDAAQAMRASAISLILLAIVGLLALASLACAILFGPEAVRQRPVWRWSLVVIGMIAIPIGLWVIVAASGPPGPMMLINAVVFGGPVVVGIRYARLLL
jgi:hypothetical protein